MRPSGGVLDDSQTIVCETLSNPPRARSFVRLLILLGAATAALLISAGQAQADDKVAHRGQLSERLADVRAGVAPGRAREPVGHLTGPLTGHLTGHRDAPSSTSAPDAESPGTVGNSHHRGTWDPGASRTRPQDAHTPAPATTEHADPGVRTVVRKAEKPRHQAPQKAPSIDRSARPVIKTATPVMEAGKRLGHAAKQVVKSAPSVAHHAKPLADAAQPVTGAVGPVVRSAAPVADVAEDVLDAAEPVTDALPVVGQAARQVAPTLDRVSRHPGAAVEQLSATAHDAVRDVLGTAGQVTPAPGDIVAPVVEGLGEVLEPLSSTSVEDRASDPSTQDVPTAGSSALAPDAPPSSAARAAATGPAAASTGSVPAWSHDGSQPGMAPGPRTQVAGPDGVPGPEPAHLPAAPSAPAPASGTSALTGTGHAAEAVADLDDHGFFGASSAHRFAAGDVAVPPSRAALIRLWPG